MSSAGSSSQAGQVVCPNPGTSADNDRAYLPLGDGSGLNANSRDESNSFPGEDDSEDDDLDDDLDDELGSNHEVLIKFSELSSRLHEVLKRTSYTPTEKELNILTSKTTDTLFPTALYVLTRFEPTSDKDLGWLVNLLIEKSSSILNVINRTNMTALHYAITEKRDDMVRHICDAKHDFRYIIEQTDAKMKNCLHLAIENNLHLDVLRTLFNKATITALCAQDDEGNTPLHLAVKFDHCRDDQITLIRFIINECDVEMKDAEDGKENRNSTFNKSNCSPYQVWEQTLERAKNIQKERDDRRKEKFRRQHSNARGSGSGKDPLPPTIIAPKQPPSAPSRPNEATPKTNKPKELPETGDCKSRLSSMGKGHRGDVELKIRLAQEIGDFLKTHYLQNRSPNAASDILFGKGVVTDKMLYFDLHQYTKIRRLALYKVLSMANFDTTLKYVAIPDIELEMEPPSTVRKAPNGAQPPRPRTAPSKETTGIEEVFSWLQRKKVQRILEVEVHNERKPHRDEDIEAMLKQFRGVKNLDWKRLDLCSEVFINATPDVEVVHLYWAGNNAVLRGWSEPEGLRQLKKLAEVHIHAKQGLTMTIRTRSNVNEFEDRLRKNGKIAVFQHGFEEQQSISHTPAITMVKKEPDRPKDHTWTDTMDSFSRVQREIMRNFIPKELQSKMEPIRVGLIDDGIDINQLEYEPFAGCSFSHRSDERQNPWYHSPSGHGTIMAQQIYRICPYVSLYVFRLDDKAGEDHKTRIVPKSAAQAIQAAVNHQVHIISMSWTLNKCNDSEKQRLNKAISNAKEQNILIFCAAKDSRTVTDNSYPYTAAENVAFKIGGAKSSGEMTENIASRDSIHFIFPGEEVPMKNGLSLADLSPDYQSGSSVATALGAGLAALILHLVQVHRVRMLDRNNREEAEKTDVAFKNLQDHVMMREAFQSIGSATWSKNKYIPVWNKFGFQDENRNATMEEKERCFDNLCQHMAGIGFRKAAQAS